MPGCSTETKILRQMGLLIIVALILLNGVFAMSEMALVSARKSRLEAASRKGMRGAKQAVRLASHRSKFLSTVQIGITLIGILTGMISGEKIEDDLIRFLTGIGVVEPYGEQLAPVILILTLTYFTLVFGELLPKRIGLAIPELVSRTFAPLMALLSRVTAPFTWLLTASTDTLIRLFNIKPADRKITEDEILEIIEEGARTGAIEEIEQDIMENVFYLGDRKLHTLMTPRKDVEWLNIQDPAEINYQKIIASEHEYFPVCDGQLDQIIGIYRSKDMISPLLENKTPDLRDTLRKPLYLPETNSAYNTLNAMKETKQQLVIVVDEYGGVEGILTLHDLVRALVGDFHQQLHERLEIIPRDDNTYLVDGALPLPEFIRYFGINVSPQNKLLRIKTIGGLAHYIVGASIRTGSKFTWKDLSIEVVDMDEKRIDKVMVERLPARKESV